MSGNRKYSLDKKDRLHGHTRIRQLFDRGKKLNFPGLRVLYLVSRKQPGSLQMGCSAPVRQFRKAVDRNRVRRQIREAWRLQKEELDQYCQEQGWEIDLFIICTSREMPDYDILYKMVGKIPARLKMICDENAG